MQRTAEILKSRGWDVRTLVAASITDLEAACLAFNPGIVFSAADHLPAEENSSPGEDLRNIHAWLEEHGHACVGSSPPVIELALDKAGLKRRWISDGIPTPDFRFLEAPQFALHDLPAFPCIVKPNDTGNSRGISKMSVVHDRKGLAAHIDGLRHEFSRFLVEHYLGFAPDFQEFTCGMIGNGTQRRHMAARIVLPEPDRASRESTGDMDSNCTLVAPVVTTEDKNSGRAQAVPIEDAQLKARVEDCARKAFASAGVRDYARCDLALSDGTVYAIEINGQPMVPDTWFGACARNSGMNGDEYLVDIVETAIRRVVDAGGTDRDCR